MNTRGPVQCGRQEGGRRLRGCRGILLIDCLVYIALLALILGLSFGAFYRSLDHSTRLERNVADVVRAMKAGERWRQDVRSAAQPIQVERRAGEVALRIPHAEGEVRYLFREGALYREAPAGGARFEVLAQVRATDFYEDTAEGVTSWRWELELRGREGSARVHPLFTFQAVAVPANKR